MRNTLIRTVDDLTNTQRQVEILSNSYSHFPQFHEKLQEHGIITLKPFEIEIMQINLGKMCNQTCAHCHVDAGPARKEIMSREVLNSCLNVLKKEKNITTVDVTGGAPEMNPDFRWFVKEATSLNKKVIVRSNLTILVSNPKYYDYPDFFRDNRVTVISSLPCYTAGNTDKQRGDGVFEKSIKALQNLNAVGFGVPDSGLELHLVYNPLGPSLPPSQVQLQSDYKRELKENFNIVFNDLYTITNLPINRFLDRLQKTDRYQDYMTTLVNAFNPAAIKGLMCRNTISVSWDGFLYDCDFNQMLDLKLAANSNQHINNYDSSILTEREIVTSRHCYGCTAGAGSTCQGAIV